jgi:citrate synthase
MIIEDRIAAQLPDWQDRVKRLVHDFGSQKVCEITVEQIFGGMRGVHVQVSDISYLDPYKGILFRGYTMQEIITLLPKVTGAEYPMAGGLYYLLMTDELPTLEQALAVESEWKKRSPVPGYVFDMLDTLPAKTHPMTMFSQAILALQNESIFSNSYTDGLRKPEYWRATLEDSLNLTAKLPAIAAYIYNRKYRNGLYIAPDPDLDWSANFAHMIGKADDWHYADLTRLFFILHSDHEGANVSAHVSALVNSALSDIYYASSAAMNGLAGPLHGVANQECIRWLLDLRAAFDAFPTREQIEAYAWDLLNSGRVIPGYGHAVLRVTDPRFTAQLEFGKKHLPDDELLKLVILVYETLPAVLTEYGKIKNPWPNVDAITGTLQYHYGVKEPDFYTVLFGVSRILGLTTHAVWSRALGRPIERPKSMTTKMLEDLVYTD